MRKHFVTILSTFFYIGYSPFAPGTCATVAALALAIILKSDPAFYIIVIVVLGFLGFCFSGGMEKIEGRKDPSCVVIDEVVGGLIAFYGLPLNFSVLITAFFLFRAFDMFKIFPVNRLESLHGSVGIMCDDVFAGANTFLVMHAALRFVNL